MTATLLNTRRLSLEQHVPDLGHDAVRPAKHVASREAKQSDTRHQEAILTPVVLNDAGAMCFTVVLDSQLPIRVIEIRPAEKSAFTVVERHLHLGAWKTTEHEQHSQARFHRGLGRLLGVFKDTPSGAHALSATAAADPVLQFGLVDHARMKRHVGDDDGLDQPQPPAEVKQRVGNRDCSESTPNHNLLEVGRMQDNLDRFAASNLQAMQPGGSHAGEGGPLWQAAPGGLELQSFSFRKTRPGVNAGTQPAPAFALEVPAGEAGPPGFGHGKRPVHALRPKTGS